MIDVYLSCTGIIVKMNGIYIGTQDRLNKSHIP